MKQKYFFPEFDQSDDFLVIDYHLYRSFKTNFSFRVGLL